MSRYAPPVLILFAGLLGPVGCSQSSNPPPQPPPPAPLPEGEKAVRLRVLYGNGGGALALVDVHINGQGPFTFILDTGASHTTIDADVANQLGLPAAGGKMETVGLMQAGNSEPVRVENWTLGDIPLPAVTAAKIPLPDVERRYKLHGLLGSDVLSRYGAVRVDYDGQMLVLRPKAATDARPGAGGS